MFSHLYLVLIMILFRSCCISEVRSVNGCPPTSCSYANHHVVSNFHGAVADEVKTPPATFERCKHHILDCRTGRVVHVRTRSRTRRNLRRSPVPLGTPIVQHFKGARSLANYSRYMPAEQTCTEFCSLGEMVSRTHVMWRKIVSLSLDLQVSRRLYRARTVRRRESPVPRIVSTLPETR